ncbi:MAG: hypothetical protein DHS20C13_12460 [Thermodesulfobacteriota bacterium]|nr:MAG: hypothetical protein DHS20C13_12460 [Thermodesulfobacteriota bacterium]
MESLDSSSRLANIIKGLKNQKNKYLLLKGPSVIAIFFFITIGLVTIISLISSDPYFYAFLKILTILLLVFAVFKLVIAPIYRKTITDSLLEELENLSPGLGEDTVNAIELTDTLTKSKALGTSKDLAFAHISKTTHKLESFNLSSLYPISNLRKYFVPLAGGILFAALAIIFIPGSFPSYFFSSNIFPSTSGPHLKLADIQITVKYPEYTKREPELIKGGSGDVKAIKGTEVQFEAKPLSTFKEGSLFVKNSAPVPIITSDGRIKSGFTILNDGSYVITENSTGLTSESFMIVAQEDRVPEIQISSPSGKTVELGSEENIEIFYEAEDDFNISKLTLTWENQKTQSELPITIKESGTNVIKGKLTWGPSGINPEDGDTIKLRVFAYDNDTISGPKVGVSNPITIKLKDARSKHKETLNYAGQLMEELIDILGDEINLVYKNDNETTQNSGSSSRIIDTDEILKKQKKLTQKIENAVSTLDITLSSMAEDEYSDYTFFVGLTNMGIRLRSLLDERKYLIESFTKIDFGRLQRLMKREIPEFEDDILLIDSILKGDKLIDSLRSSNDLLNQYRELSELLNELQNGDNAEIENQIQEKLNQIKELISQLAKKMDGLSGDIQEGFLNQDAFEALNMQKQLDQISKLAQEGKIEQALDMLASMSQSLQNMIASLENGMQSFGSSMMAQEMSKLNELVSRLDNIEREESSLKDNTDELKKSLLENPNLQGENLREFIEKEMKKAERLTQNLKKARAKVSKKSPLESSSEGAYLIEKMIEKTQQLSNWLKAMDFNEAVKNARSIQESTQGLSEMSNLNFGNLGKASEEIDSASKLANEIRNDLERFGAQKGNQGQFAQMAERQDEIQGQTGDLNEELSELGSGFFVAPGLGEKLGEAENFMGNASQDLRGRQISKAISNQEEALKALRDAKQQAQDMLQQMRMSAKGNGSSAPMMLGQRQSGQSPQGTDKRYVEIPQIDESQVGKEYKQRILEAMKGGSPEGYIELNKKYYDRIIK